MEHGIEKEKISDPFWNTNVSKEKWINPQYFVMKSIKIYNRRGKMPQKQLKQKHTLHFLSFSPILSFYFLRHNISTEKEGMYHKRYLQI